MKYARISYTAFPGAKSMPGRIIFRFTNRSKRGILDCEMQSDSNWRREAVDGKIADRVVLSCPLPIHIPQRAFGNTIDALFRGILDTFAYPDLRK